ncbi:hypothetical protein FGE12_14705 [Aggregicoccus sp. 17bor-14]|uniref:anti-sigma factor family protein n=1 Tax=Myxococcaceae TaxID=31 RepID=UPI00129C7AB0|nr:MULTISPECIES: zf-HC2 domain-containing protein [Myxococcaceae]MBF5043644.1 zf-HC2 domain-containing protein [Simulacricoccus sp. 17bor-14]MRI89403.1 hypothetical protein [Aggregicoccus sp. 17bor-14]
MSCTYEEELTAYIDGELEAPRAREVQAHLAGCAACRRTEGLLRHTLARLPELPEPALSPHTRRAVLARVEALPRPLSERLGAAFKPLLRPVLLVPGLAAVALAVVLLQAQQEPSVGSLLLPETADPVAFEVASNMELAEDYDVVGLDSPEDLEVIANLHTLERQR